MLKYFFPILFLSFSFSLSQCVYGDCEDGLGIYKYDIKFYLLSNFNNGVMHGTGFYLDFNNNHFFISNYSNGELEYETIYAHPSTKIFLFEKAISLDSIRLSKINELKSYYYELKNTYNQTINDYELEKIETEHKLGEFEISFGKDKLRKILEKKKQKNKVSKKYIKEINSFETMKENIGLLDQQINSLKNTLSHYEDSIISTTNKIVSLEEKIKSYKNSIDINKKKIPTSFFWDYKRYCVSCEDGKTEILSDGEYIIVNFNTSNINPQEVFLKLKQYVDYPSSSFFKVFNVMNGKFDGNSKSWYSNGNLEQEENYKNGKIDGFQKRWYNNGQLHYERYFEDGLKNGSYKEWFESGQLSIELKYKDDKKDGFQKRWYSNGQISFTGEYKDGKPIGLHQDYAIDGEDKDFNYQNFSKSVLYMENNYDNNGEYHGVQLEYAIKAKRVYNSQTKSYEYIADPILILEENYKNGLGHGNFKEFDYEHGELMTLEVYKDGFMTKRVDYFCNLCDKDDYNFSYIKNQKKEEEVYVVDENGHEIAHGLHKSWRANGNKETEISYVNGEMNGIYKHWGENNRSYTESTYVNDQEEGIEKYFYDDLLHSVAFRKNGELSGIETEFYYNDFMLRQTLYKDGEKIKRITFNVEYDEGLDVISKAQIYIEELGEKTFFDDLPIYSIERFKGWDLNGLYEQFYDNGNLEYSVVFKNGIEIDKTRKCFDYSGKKVSCVLYKY